MGSGPQPVGKGRGSRCGFLMSQVDFKTGKCPPVNLRSSNVAQSIIRNCH